MTSATRITRGQFLAGAGAFALPLVLGGRDARAAALVRRATQPRGSLVLSSRELAQVKANIFDLELGFARRAWENTRDEADNWLGYQPSPPRDDVPVTDWHAQLYTPGLHDGDAAYALGLAYAIAGRADHARRSRDICLAWARTYRKSRPQSEIGHMVAEPVGPVIKLCMAYQLARPLFSAAEAAEFRGWAAQFVEKGKRNADFAMDDPWVPDVVYGSDRTNVAAHGNSATWQRTMAVWAAATVGGGTFRSALEWNFAHVTAGGNPYGWDELLEGLIIDGAKGQVVEDRYRNSLEYGMYSWGPLLMIADLARRAGFHTNLFDYATKRNGYTVLTPVPYYAYFITKDSVEPSLERTRYGGSEWQKTAARWRAFFEVPYRNTNDPSALKTLRRVVGYGGPQQRGDNYDIYMVGYGGLLGRGPKGPMPEAPARRKPRGKRRTQGP